MIISNICGWSWSWSTSTRNSLSLTWRGGGNWSFLMACNLGTDDTTTILAFYSVRLSPQYRLKLLRKLICYVFLIATKAQVNGHDICPCSHRCQHPRKKHTYSIDSAPDKTQNSPPIKHRICHCFGVDYHCKNRFLLVSI